MAWLSYGTVNIVFVMIVIVFRRASLALKDNYNELLVICFWCRKRALGGNELLI